VFSPTVLWEMAQSPRRGRAAVERSSPRADSWPITSSLFRTTLQPSHLCSHVCSSPSCQPARHIHLSLPLLWCSRWCAALLCTWEDDCGEGGAGDNKKETSLCPSSLNGSSLAGPWVKGQSGQSCIGNTSCRSSPTSCLRWGHSAGQCSGRMTRSDLPPHRGSCQRWQSPHLQDDVTVACR